MAKWPVEKGSLATMYFKQQIIYIYIYIWDLTYVLVGFVPIDFGCATTPTLWTMYCFVGFLANVWH
jgi:hypothetical protein